MNKPVLALLCFAFAAVCTAQDLTKPITYRTVAIPLHSALDAISKQAGFTLAASEELENEPIIVVLKDATVKGTMDHIASTIGGEWTKRSDKEFLLVRTEEIEKKLEKEAVDRREANIKESLNRLTKDRHPNQSSEEFYRQSARDLSAALKLADQQNNTRPLNQTSSRNASYDAMISLLKLIPARFFAELHPGQKVVLSTNPNSMQQTLPDGADAVIDQFEQNQNIFADEFARAHPEPLPQDVVRRYGSRIRTIKARPAKLLLIIHGTEFLSGSPSIEFVAVGADGSAIGDASESLTVESFDKQSAERQILATKTKGDPEIPLSQESQMFSDLFKSMENRMGDPPELTQKQQELLLRPVDHDPLSFLVSDGFLALADQTKTNLVACPADNLFFINFDKVDNGGFKLATFLDEVNKDGIDVATDANWTTARCYDLPDEQRGRTNRECLNKCLIGACTQGYISIESAAQLAMSEDAERSADLPWTYALLGERYAPYTVGSKQLLRFYATLTPALLSAMQAGGLPAGTLSKEQWQALEQLAFQGRLQLDGKSPDEFGDLGSYILIQEPTELLPDSLPINTVVTLASAQKEVLFAGMKSADTNQVYGGETTLEDIAQTLAYHQAGKPMDGGFNWDIAWVSRGQSNNLDFKFVYTQHVKSSGSLREIVRGRDRWTVDSLPSDLDAKLKAALIAEKAKLDQTPAPTTTEPTAKPPRL